MNHSFNSGSLAGNQANLNNSNAGRKRGFLSGMLS